MRRGPTYVSTNVDLFAPDALNEAKRFLTQQGYKPVRNTNTSVTMERRQGLRTFVLEVLADPQPQGGVRLKIIGDHSDPVPVERLGKWNDWAHGLPKKVPTKPDRNEAESLSDATPASDRTATISNDNSAVGTPGGFREFLKKTDEASKKMSAVLDKGWQAAIRDRSARAFENVKNQFGANSRTSSTGMGASRAGNEDLPTHFDGESMPAKERHDARRQDNSTSGKRDISSRLERFEPAEERLGVRLTGLFAEIDSDGELIRLNGELHTRKGHNLKQDIEVVATVHDSSGRVVNMQTAGFYSDSFFGFEAFSLLVTVGDEDPAMIRMYPKAL